MPVPILGTKAPPKVDRLRVCPADYMTLIGFDAARGGDVSKAFVAALGGSATGIDIAVFSSRTLEGHTEPHELLGIGTVTDALPSEYSPTGLEPEEEGAEGGVPVERLFMSGVVIEVPASGAGIYARHLPLVVGAEKEKAKVVAVGDLESEAGIIDAGEHPIPRTETDHSTNPQVSTPEPTPFEFGGTEVMEAELDPEPEWNNATAYTPGNLVSWAGQNWENILAGTNNEPIVGGLHWTPLGETLVKLTALINPHNNPQRLRFTFSWNHVGTAIPAFFGGRVTPEPGKSLGLTGGLRYFMGFIPRGGDIVIPLTHEGGGVVRHKEAGTFADDPAVSGTGAGAEGEEGGLGYGISTARIDCLI